MAARPNRRRFHREQEMSDRKKWSVVGVARVLDKNSAKIVSKMRNFLGAHAPERVALKTCRERKTRKKSLATIDSNLTYTKISISKANLNVDAFTYVSFNLVREILHEFLNVVIFLNGIL